MAILSYLFIFFLAILTGFHTCKTNTNKHTKHTQQQAHTSKQIEHKLHLVLGNIQCYTTTCIRFTLSDSTKPFTIK